MRLEQPCKLVNAQYNSTIEQESPTSVSGERFKFLSQNYKINFLYLKIRNVYNIIKNYNYNSKLGCGIVEDLYKKQAETNKTNWIKQIIKQL